MAQNASDVAAHVRSVQQKWPDFLDHLDPDTRKRYEDALEADREAALTRNNEPAERKTDDGERPEAATIHSSTLQQAFLNCGLKLEDLEEKTPESFQAAGVSDIVAAQRFANYNMLRLRRIHRVLEENERLLRSVAPPTIPPPVAPHPPPRPTDSSPYAASVGPLSRSSSDSWRRSPRTVKDGLLEQTLRQITFRALSDHRKELSRILAAAMDEHVAQFSLAVACKAQWETQTEMESRGTLAAKNFQNAEARHQAEEKALEERHRREEEEQKRAREAWESNEKEQHKLAERLSTAWKSERASHNGRIRKTDQRVHSARERRVTEEKLRENEAIKKVVAVEKKYVRHALSSSLRAQSLSDRNVAELTAQEEVVNRARQKLEDNIQKLAAIQKYNESRLQVTLEELAIIRAKERDQRVKMLDERMQSRQEAREKARGEILERYMKDNEKELERKRRLARCESQRQQLVRENAIFKEELRLENLRYLAAKREAALKEKEGKFESRQASASQRLEDVQRIRQGSPVNMSALLARVSQ